jgi:hypothetical protein
MPPDTPVHPQTSTHKNATPPLDPQDLTSVVHFLVVQHPGGRALLQPGLDLLGGVQRIAPRNRHERAGWHVLRQQRD